MIQKMSATIEITTGKIDVETYIRHAENFIADVAKTYRLYAKIEGYNQNCNDVIGPSHLQKIISSYNPKVNATIEIPTSNLETVAAPENVVVENPQSYEQGTDQNDPNVSATAEMKNRC